MDLALHGVGVCSAQQRHSLAPGINPLGSAGLRRLERRGCRGNRHLYPCWLHHASGSWRLAGSAFHKRAGAALEQLDLGELHARRHEAGAGIAQLQRGGRAPGLQVVVDHAGHQGRAGHQGHDGGSVLIRGVRSQREQRKGIEKGAGGEPPERSRPRQFTPPRPEVGRQGTLLLHEPRKITQSHLLRMLRSLPGCAAHDRYVRKGRGPRPDPAAGGTVHHAGVAVFLL